jgi:regulator of replication initiation timing
MDFKSEKSKIEKQIEITSKQIQQLQKQANEVANENVKLQGELRLLEILIKDEEERTKVK